MGMNKLVAKLGQKGIVCLSILLTSLVFSLLHAIRVYFLKIKYFKKGEDAAKEYWEEEQKKWENRVNEIKRDSNKTIKEKIDEVREIKKQFEEYIKQQNEKTSK